MYLDMVVFRLCCILVEYETSPLLNTIQTFSSLSVNVWMSLQSYVECSIAEKVSSLVRFVEILREELDSAVRQHGGPRLRLIFYDSISYLDGRLSWQNALNLDNVDWIAPGRSDSLFLNYFWKCDGDHLSSSRECFLNRFPASSSEHGEAKRLQEAILVGIDVFGRGTPCGEGPLCSEACRAAISLDLSVAIFAPGWSYESRDTEERKLGHDSFLRRDSELWNYCIPQDLFLFSICNRYGVFSALQEAQIPRRTLSLPFFSHYCCGVGYSFSLAGEVSVFLLFLSLPPPYSLSLVVYVISSSFFLIILTVIVGIIIGLIFFF